jgi:hypothetical protein
MTTVIVLQPLLTDCQLERLWDDFWEAVLYEKRASFETRVALERFDKNGLPVYAKIPDDELTYVEWRCNQ